RGRAERPHIGEYAGKTNAFAGCTAMQPAHFTGPTARFPPAVWREIGAYWPWVFSTWSQAAEIFVRFSFRQARTTKSPWSMTLRQWRWTSRRQAACSSAVPWRCGTAACWAKAADVDETRARAKTNLRM